MDEQDNLNLYNADTVHDMWVDFDHYENTGTPEVFNEADPVNFIDYINDWN